MSEQLSPAPQASIPCRSLISFRRRKWVLEPAASAAVEALARPLRCPPLIAELLLKRGVSTVDEARAFLQPEFKNLCPPGKLPNIDKAASRIAEAVRAQQKIVLYGDYDVDGITGTAMLWHTLRAAGADVSYYIPHRVDEGYGLNTRAIEQLIDAGAGLLITVDCGGSAVGPIAAAVTRGVDVVVSDHHELPEELPPAYAIVHPRLPGSEYPNQNLCGAGVAFKLAWCVAQKLCNAEKVAPVYRDLLVEFAALVALGTVADVVPLVGENRILVKYGLAQLMRTKFEGLRALIEAAGYGAGGAEIDSVAVGFSLGPRLNAAGRMGHAREAVELLTTATGPRCQEIATYLESQNRERQATERAIYATARAQVEAHVSANAALPHVIVVHHENFHAGVVGIVASRIVEQFHRPAFVLATDEAHAHGSARSIPGFELHLAIEHCRDLLVSGGGHAMAGGVKMPLANIGDFQARLNAYAANILDAEQLTPTLPIDAEITLETCNVRTLEMLEAFEPFGRGNPGPRFLLRNATISAPPRRVGADGSHLQLQITQGSRAARCIAFRMGSVEPQIPVGTAVDIVAEARVDRYFEANPRVELQVVDIAKCDGAPLPAKS